MTGNKGATVAIAGLTSSWASGEDREDERRFLAVGQFQAGPALERLRAVDADVRVVMLHHPLESLQREDERSLLRDLSGACDVLLRGHLHQTELKVTVDPDWGFVALAAGSAYETQWTKNGYLLVRASVADADVRFKINARRWAIDGNFFAADTTTYYQGRNNGIFELDLPRRL